MIRQEVCRCASVFCMLLFVVRCCFGLPNSREKENKVSVVVAEIVMQNIEERALATCRQTIPLWLRYFDDTFTAVHKDEIDAFHNHLNEQNTDVQFTREIEEDGKLVLVVVLKIVIVKVVVLVVVVVVMVMLVVEV